MKSSLDKLNQNLLKCLEKGAKGALGTGKLKILRSYIAEYLQNILGWSDSQENKRRVFFICDNSYFAKKEIKGLKNLISNRNYLLKIHRE